MKYKIITLGCKVNQAESLDFEKDFLGAGLIWSGENENADYVVVNTCCVTRVAERKSRKAIRWALKNFPGASIWATGCAVNLDKDLKIKIPAVSKFFANEEKKKLREQISSLGAARKKITVMGKGTESTVPKIVSPRVPLKVSDGCNEQCTYCIVPAVRGRVSSRPLEEIISEAKSLVSAGKKELILTAINLGLYGADFQRGRGSMINLIKSLAAISGLHRLRLSSIEPMYFDDELIDFLLGQPKVCPHFYIPLQSGSARILKMMGRRYTPEEFQKIIDKIKKINPDAAINTDVIVGFPGEDRADFKDSYEFVKNAGFSRIHVFPYSPRPGTLAAGLPSQLGSREIKERVNRMLELRIKIMDDFHQKFIGRAMEVLPEQYHPDTGRLEGLTKNYLRVIFSGPADLIGQPVSVKIEKLQPEFVIGSYKT